jgi:hypothetical protein
VLSVLVYGMVLFFFFNILTIKKHKQEEVLIHTAIIPSVKNVNIRKRKKSVINTGGVRKNNVKQTKKRVKIGSKSNYTTGGNSNLQDLFKTVNENIPTAPLKLKKNLRMSRFRGLSQKIEKNLNRVKYLSVNVEITQNSDNKLSKKNLNGIIDKIGKIWYQLSTIAGQYAKIHIISLNGEVKVQILDSNLPQDLQNELINDIESLNFKKNFDLNILFQTKVNK